MAGETRSGRARQAGEQFYAMAVQVTAAAVVLLTFAGLAYLVSMGHIEGGALLLYAGVILGYILSTAWRHRRTG